MSRNNTNRKRQRGGDDAANIADIALRTAYCPTLKDKRGCLGLAELLAVRDVQHAGASKRAAEQSNEAPEDRPWRPRTECPCPRHPSVALTRNQAYSRTIAAGALAFILVLTLANIASAHPFHTSVAEAEWNAETKRLEVALRVAADDFETALNAHSESRIRFDESDSADEAIQAYLKETFVIRRTKEEVPLELKWIGKEVTTKAAWLYFEIDAPDSVEGYELTNRVLLETEETQINTLAIKLNGRKVSLRCDRKKPTVLIQLDVAEESTDKAE